MLAARAPQAKIDYWRADLRYIYWIRVSTNQVLASCFFWKFIKGESFLKLESHVVESADPDQTPQNC